MVPKARAGRGDFPGVADAPVDIRWKIEGNSKLSLRPTSLDTAFGKARKSTFFYTKRARRRTGRTTGIDFRERGSATEFSPWREPWDRGGKKDELRMERWNRPEEMAHTYTELLVHVVFSTKDRLQTIGPEFKDRLFAFMGGILKEAGARPILINGPRDHVHLLFAMPGKVGLADLMREVKAVSSLWVHKNIPAERLFAWQTGYAAFSVSHSNCDIVRNYIANQEEHHRKVGFKDEFLQLLKKHEIDFDERYLWD